MDTLIFINLYGRYLFTKIFIEFYIMK